MFLNKTGNSKQRYLKANKIEGEIRCYLRKNNSTNILIYTQLFKNLSLLSQMKTNSKGYKKKINSIQQNAFASRIPA